MAIKTAELAELIKSRCSIRAWQDKPVPEELLLQAIELATHAPNAGNQQNWHFYLILKRDTINSIADAVATRSEHMAVWPEAKKVGDNAAGYLQRSAMFRSAPVGIAVSVTKYQSPVDQVLALRENIDPEAKLMREWRNSAAGKIQTASSAIANLLLVLHQMGLGAVWMTGPIQAKGDIEKILKVPAGEDIMAYIPVGYPNENPAPKARKPVKEICTIIK